MATGLDMVLPRAAWLWGCPAVGLPLAGRRAGVSVWAGSAGGGHLGGRDLETSHQALGNARDGRSGHAHLRDLGGPGRSQSQVWEDFLPSGAQGSPGPSSQPLPPSTSDSAQAGNTQRSLGRIGTEL